ncbi:MAG TPA: PDZ domain-containing protein [Phycisphaerae bacterium]|nr:PDZ domain-containing protein [Phycisphaerae bacterium]HRY66490.1 PDZ domain-containing protein [Phycisphaerae bacterium]
MSTLPFYMSICLAGCLPGLAAGASPASDDRRPPALLASHVPVDARLFLEIEDTQSLSSIPAGAALSDVLALLVAQVRTSGEATTTAPAFTGWRRLLSDALGLRDERAAMLLLDGRLAIAAEDWTALDSAVLIAQPRRPEALESQLKTRIPAAESIPGMRQYRLDLGYEITGDGHVFIVGRQTREGSLHARCLALLSTDRGVALADLVEFRERVSEVPPNAQVVLYLGTNQRRSGPATQPTGDWWPILSPPVRSLAMGAVLTDEGVALETTGRLAAGQEFPRHTPPVEALLFLPPSAIFAWSYPFGYVNEYRRFMAAPAQTPQRFYLEVLQWGLPAGRLENDLLRHLVGDTVCVIARIPVYPKGKGTGNPLLMPTFAFAVQTDDSDKVDDTLRQMTRNLLRLVNLPPTSDNPVQVEEETLRRGWSIHGNNGEFEVEPPHAACGTLRSIPLGRLFPPGLYRELFGATELSWIVCDGWLVMGTHRETIRQIVEARRGRSPLMSAQALQQAMRRAQPPRRFPDMVLLAQPGAASEVIDSWLNYIGRNHPEMLEPKWWQQLRRQSEVPQVQLGILPAPGSANGEVEVAEVLPDFPAARLLQVGDRLTAVDGRKLDLDRPLQSLKERLAKREHDDCVRLTVLRDGESRDIDVPMPVQTASAAAAQPLTLLRQLSQLLRGFAFASYTTWQASRDVIQTRLDLKLAPALTETATASPARPAGTPPHPPATVDPADPLKPPENPPSHQ